MIYHKLYITILYNVIVNTQRYTINDAGHNRKVWWNAHEYSMTYLRSDWLYFLWPGVKCV